jgi:hypothetical protein
MSSLLGRLSDCNTIIEYTPPASIGPIREYTPTELEIFAQACKDISISHRAHSCQRSPQEKAVKVLSPQEDESDYDAYAFTLLDLAVRRCFQCHTDTTPYWRRGPAGMNTLCNACGLRFAKLNKKQGFC